MASNDDSPEPPPGLAVEDLKKQNTLDFDKLEEIIHNLRMYILALPVASDNEVEEADSSKDHTVLNELFELVERAKKNNLITIKETSNENKNFPSNQTPGWRFDSLVAHSSNPSPNVEIPYIGSLDRASNSRRKRVSSSSFCRLSSRSSDSSRRCVSQSALSSNKRSLGSNRSKVCSQSRRYCSSQRHGSYDSSSTSPEDTYYHKKEEDCHNRFRYHRSYDYCKRSPVDTANHHKNKNDHHKGCKSRRSLFRKRSNSRESVDGEDVLNNKNEEDCHERFRYRRSYDYCKRSPEDTAYYHKNKKDYHKGCKSRRSLFRKRSNSRESMYGEDVQHNRKEVDRRKRFRHHQSWDSCSRSTKNTYYCDKDDCSKYRKSRQVPCRQRWSSNGSTDEENTTPKKRLKSDASTKSWPNKFRKFSIESEGEHSLTLEELKSARRLLPDSDENRDVRTKKGRRLAASARIDSDEDQTNFITMESDDGSKKVSDVKFSCNKKKNVEEKNENLDKKFNIPNNFFCHECQIGLSSELVWESHIKGKNHAKQLRKQAVYEVSKGSLAFPVAPAIFENGPRFANAPPGKKLIRINAIPRLQQTINGTRSFPLPGLDYVQEIISDMEVKYYCELCDAPCQSISILSHLVGSRHQIMAVRKIAPAFYEQNKDKKFMDMLKIKSILMRHERSEGRGSIKVFQEIDNLHSRPSYDQHGPSSRNFSFPSIKREPNQGESENDASKDKDRWLDMSKGVFYCTLCDSHMNNLNMWEAHVRGKRHLANAKKFPGECISKMKSERLHGVPSILEAMIDEELFGEIVVGLDFVRETRGSNGELFNCFLCGACSTKIDILDHLLLLKHRTKYLEKLHADGFENSIKEIDSLELTENSYRSALINSECMKMLKKYGRGKVEVYQSKN